MPVPSVSHKNWERLRLLTQYHMGTFNVDAREMSFERQLEYLLDGPNWAAEYERINNKDGHYSLKDFRTPRKDYYNPHERDRPHRPEVSEGLDRRLTDYLKDAHSLPADSFDFEKRLDLFLDDVRKCFAAGNCLIKPRRS